MDVNSTGPEMAALETELRRSRFSSDEEEEEPKPYLLVFLVMLRPRDMAGLSRLGW